MIDVWILVFYIGSASPFVLTDALATVGGGGPAVVDNLATEEACLAVQAKLPKPFFATTVKSECVKVQKVKVQ